MTVAELIEELRKLPDQSAVVVTRYDNADPFEVDNRVRVVGGMSWGRRASVEGVYTNTDICELREIDAPHDANDFAAIIIG